MPTTIYRVIPVFLQIAAVGTIHNLGGGGRKLISIRTSHVYDQTVVKLGVRALHIPLFCMCWFCENRHKQRTYFPYGRKLNHIYACQCMSLEAEDVVWILCTTPRSTQFLLLLLLLLFYNTYKNSPLSRCTWRNGNIRQSTLRCFPLAVSGWCLYKTKRKFNIPRPIQLLLCSYIDS
jgi:hypothetical protein